MTDHPVGTPRTTAILELGDWVVVCGQTFVLSEVWISRDQPPTLITNALSELMEEQKETQDGQQ